MSAESFFDANVLLYVFSNDERKAMRAESLLNQGGTISVQVLNEMANIERRKFGHSIDDIRQSLAVVRASCIVKPVDVATHERGLDLHQRYGYRIYDSMILASAIGADCETLYSEDMQHGQRIGGLTIRNPFRK